MIKTIKDFDLNNKIVLIRVDFNVPVKEGKIVDDNRIKESLETINYAINNNAKVVLLSHMGRIKTEEDKKKNSLDVVARRLADLLNKKVYFANDFDFEKIKRTLTAMNYGDVILLENTRYFDLDNKKESSNDSELAKSFASLGDIFINDAFATIHRAHASNVGIASILPSGIGLLVEKELKNLHYLDNPEPEYTVILGGAKVSDKIGVISNLVTKCNHLVIGGAMANTFLKAKGVSVGKSLVEDDYLEFASDILSKYQDKIILPIDVKVATDINPNYTIKDITNISLEDMILDIGPKTVELIKETLINTKSVFWNGPLGYYELDEYLEGTKSLLTYLVEKDIKLILGGGDIVACSNVLGLKDKVYYASTGGGATLEYLEGKELPGLKIIDKE